MKYKESKWTTNDGVTIHVFTDHQLNAAEKKELEVGVTNQHSNKNTVINNGGSTPQNIIPDGDGSTTVGGPNYKTYDNTITRDGVNIAIGAVVGYISSYFGASQAATTAWGAAGSFIGIITDASQYIPNTYWGFRTTKSYSSYYGAYMIYETDTQYYDSSYSTVKNCYYYDTSLRQ